MGAITHSGEVLQGLPGVASQVNYDNSDSGLSATQVQDAIDEVNEKIDTLGTASTKDVPVSGNASTSQVVMGNDTRLSDARPASDVSAWAKANSKPSYNASEVGAEPNGGTSTGNKTFNVGGKLQLRTDSEGGNITLGAPDGKHFMEMDIYDNNNLRMYFWDNDNQTVSGAITKSVNGFTDLDDGTFVKKGAPVISDIFKDSRLPSSNQQLFNFIPDTNNNLLYIGNPSTMQNIIFQSTNGSKSLTDIMSAVNSVSVLNSFANSFPCKTSGSWKAWDSSYASNPLQLFFYEGANKTAMDLPTEHCFVLTMWQSGAGRACALCIQWPFQTNNIWMRGCHDSFDNDTWHFIGGNMSGSVSGNTLNITIY